MEIIHILEPYYSAGKKYGWLGNSHGLGIDLRLLQGEGSIFVTVGKDPKILTETKENILNFIKKYNSYYTAKTVDLGVVQSSFLKEYKQ